MSGAGVAQDTAGAADTNASVGGLRAVVGAEDLSQKAGESNVSFIGKEPRLVSRSGDLINPVQQGMCAGVCNSHAEVTGKIDISMQYLFATAGKFELTTEARVLGDVKVYAERPGAVGGSMKIALEAKTLGVEVTDSDPEGGGFADKTVIVSHAQLQPLKVVFGPGMNFMSDIQVEIGSGAPGGDGVTVTSSQPVFVDVQDTVDDAGVRCVILTPGKPPAV